MLACSGLALDGTPVDGFEFDGVTLSYRGLSPVEASVRIALQLPPTGDPQWLVPGVFYGENRPESCTRIFPRFTPGRVDVARMESDAWSFRADRCATPAVFARGGGLVTTELSPLGQSGVGFSYVDGVPTIWLDFPYREEPLRYDGSDEPAAPDVQTHRWTPGEQVELTVSVNDGDWRRALQPSDKVSQAAWVSVDEAAELAAYGLWRWHYKPDPARLIETRSFDGAEERGIPVVTPRSLHAGIACVRPRDADAASARLNEARVAHSVREATIRLSPHCYTTTQEIEHALEALS